MSLISADEARRQVRGEPADDVELDLYARGAERAVMRFMNRVVYEDAAKLEEGRTAGRVRLDEAQAALDAAISAEYESASARVIALRQARIEFIREAEEARQMIDGMVINEDTKIAMLLMVGHFFRNRESVIVGTIASDLPLGVISLVWNYRVGLGV